LPLAVYPSTTTRSLVGRIATIRRESASSSSFRALDAGAGIGCIHDDADSNAWTLVGCGLPDLEAPRMLTCQL
jgi:hypothetical protein